MNYKINTMISSLFEELTNEIHNIDDKVSLYNEISNRLYFFLNIEHPTLNVQLIESNKINANDYNPNVVAKPEYKLLEHSILSDGLTLPIVTGKESNGNIVIIDGFHRTKLLNENKVLRGTLHGYIPVVILNKELEKRMASTVRHNIARGIHQVELTSNLVKKLIQLNWNDEDIVKEIGMDIDEVLRMKQITGLASLFSKHEFSIAWK